MTHSSVTTPPFDGHGEEPGSPRARVWAQIVDQHAFWIAVNPVQGCPKGCAYCFLRHRGQTRVAPVRLCSPREAVQMLLASDLYAPERAVAWFTWTDVMATASSRRYLHEVLTELAERAATNTTVLITKCEIPEETVGQIVAARASGVPVVVYLSYSGLGADVEVGIRHEAALGNFARLHEAGVPIVHYWRPALPASATPQIMARVLDIAARYATCTVAAGLKVEPADRERLTGLWPELADLEGAERAEGVYPQAFWDFIHGPAPRALDHPLFHTNSCALALVREQTDRFGVHGSPVCAQRNRCPAAQRDRCAAAKTGAPTSQQVRSALTHRGLDGLAFTFDAARRLLILHGQASTRVASALTQDLRLRVQTDGQGPDTYWSSGTTGARPMIVSGGEQ
ncbi:MAG: hypothetical protein QG597_775 [Actinomycetota bacterium]|nr:hypothetical protein [Actinomycetota bacterium]